MFTKTPANLFFGKPEMIPIDAIEQEFLLEDFVVYLSEDHFPIVENMHENEIKNLAIKLMKDHLGLFYTLEK